MSGFADSALSRSPVDLLLHGNLLNVYSGNISESHVGIRGGKISYVGKKPIPNRNSVKLGSGYMVPAYIDGHIHIESSLMIPSQFARTVIPRGTCSVVADPHEIANVRGVEGVKSMIRDSLRTQLRVYFMIPSCVPATRLETSGAEIGIEDIKQLKRLGQILGLGEVMNYQGVIDRDKEVLGKIDACRGMVIDGHAPGLRGEGLCAYVSAGINSDHESVTEDEAAEKLSLGMWVMIREGSTAKSLAELAKIVSKGSPERAMLVTDDRHAEDLLTEGHIDNCLRRAVEAGVDPVDAVRMTTLKPAEYFGLKDLGGIAPGKWADITIVNNLREFIAEKVFIGGKIVAKDGRYLGGMKGHLPADAEMSTVNLKEIQPQDLSIPYNQMQAALEEDEVTARVIGIVEDQIVTEDLRYRMRFRHGQVQSDPERDLLKICVAERHRGTGRIGKGFVKGFELIEGAIASTVAHDSHNAIAVGTNDSDLCRAIDRLREMNGGLVILNEGKVLGELPLPVAGLMSTLEAAEVAGKVRKLKETCATLGCKLRNPFMTLSFLALPVIPKLKITDHGLVDVEKFEVVNLFVK